MLSCMGEEALVITERERHATIRDEKWGIHIVDVFILFRVKAADKRSLRLRCDAAVRNQR